MKRSRHRMRRSGAKQRAWGGTRDPTTAAGRLQESTLLQKAECYRRGVWGTQKLVHSIRKRLEALIYKD